MLAVAGLVLLLLAVGFALPRESRFVVSATVDAPAATVFVLVNDPRRIQLWSALAGDDAEPSYSGPRDGIGATMAWDSPASGRGTLTIVDSRPWNAVELRLNEGDAGEATTWFELVPGTGTTEVRWGFAHDYGFNVVGRYVGLLATGILRRDYVNRLGKLKDLAESLPRADFGNLDVERVDVAGTPLVAMTFTAAPDPDAVASALDRAYFDISQYIDRSGLQVTGPPRLILRDFVGSLRSFDAAIPVALATETPPPDERIRIIHSYSGPALKVIHTGAYARLGDTHRSIAAYLAAAGIDRAGAPWESFVSEPADVPESARVTEIYYPLDAD